jgi:sporulation protein YlmC with PRC-barrel domain
MRAKRDLDLIPSQLAATVAVAFGLTAFQAVAQPQSDQRAQPPAPAAAPGSATTPQPQEPRAQQPDMRVSELLGADVRNAQGENLGEIEELMIDMESRQVRHAVLSFGGVLGMGDKLFAYPISAFGADRGNQALVLNVPRERLAESPGFERDRYPAVTDSAWWQRIDELFGDSDQRSAAQRQRLARASELIDKDVELKNGDDVGEVEDLVVNLQDRQVKHVVIEFDRAWNMNDKLVALPISAFQQTRDGEDLVIDRSREQLQNAEAFDRNQWPDFSAGRYQQTVDRVTTAAPNVMTPPMMDMETFERLDVNRDGQVTRDEVAGDAMLQRSFQQVDRNSNGVVTREELEEFLAQQPQQDPSTVNATSGQAAGTSSAPASESSQARTER